MKLLAYNILILKLLTCSLCFASSVEWSLTLSEKVPLSSIIVVCTVDSVQYGIKKADPRRLAGQVQKVTLTVTVDELIKGDVGDQLDIICMASSSGPILHNPGFSSYALRKERQYIAYLQKKDGAYYLAFQSNQCLEPIDRTQNNASWCRSRFRVPLDRKLKRLRKIVKSIEQGNSIAYKPLEPIKADYELVIPGNYEVTTFSSDALEWKRTMQKKWTFTDKKGSHLYTFAKTDIVLKQDGKASEFDVYQNTENRSQFYINQLRLVVDFALKEVGTMLYCFSGS